MLLKILAESAGAILGHIRPDGDCLGSGTLGLYNYLRLNFRPDIRAAVYLEESSPEI